MSKKITTISTGNGETVAQETNATTTETSAPTAPETTADANETNTTPDNSTTTSSPEVTTTPAIPVAANSGVADGEATAQVQVPPDVALPTSFEEAYVKSTADNDVFKTKPEIIVSKGNLARTTTQVSKHGTRPYKETRSVKSGSHTITVTTHKAKTA